MAVLGDLVEARRWIAQLLPTADSLAPQAQAELFWAAIATAVDVGDDDTALAASRRLAPLRAEIGDPILRAISQLAIAWTAPILGEFEDGLKGALAALDQLRAHEEPYLTAIAAISVGSFEFALARYDASEQLLREARELADRFGFPFLASWSQAQLGSVALLQGHLEKGRRLLEEGLALSLDVHNIRPITQFLIGFARLALAVGDPERAALLAGAAQGLRARIGLRSWPMLRRGEAELVAQVREALGSDRMDDVFAAGSRLNLREAAAAVRDEHAPPAAA